MSDIIREESNTGATSGAGGGTKHPPSKIDEEHIEHMMNRMSVGMTKQNTGGTTADGNAPPKTRGGARPKVFTDRCEFKSYPRSTTPRMAGGARPKDFTDRRDLKSYPRSTTSMADPIHLHFEKPNCKLTYPVKLVRIECTSSDSKPAEDIKIEDYINEQSCPLFREFKNSKDFIMITFDVKYRPKKVKEILQRGIFIEQEGYFKYFGQSASQLRARKCVLYNDKLGEFREVMRKFGRFECLHQLSKIAARIGLLLSSATPTVRIEDEEIVEIKDIENNGYTFTDGCGFMSEKLANDITEELRIKWRYKGQKIQVPSVVQIRLKGCKGILILDSEPENKRLCKIRPSMEKFVWNMKPPHILAVVDGPFGVSRPNTFGKLNKQFIRLLSGLGIQDEIFLKKQSQYFDELMKLPDDEYLQVKYLCTLQHHDLAEKVMKKCSDGAVKRMIKKISTQACTIRKQSQSDKRKKTQAERLIIPIEKSRNVYGVCDPSNQLQYGQCFFQPTIRGSPQPLDIKVVVTKNPCYHPGDVRVLQCIDVQECRHLIDCIVFPVKGDRPHSDEIAGSDLDGDLYFVCWDCDLIPPRTYQAHQGSLRSNSTRRADFTQSSLLNYFANYKSSTISQLNRLYEQWVDINDGIFSDECLEISGLFSCAVDAAKTGEIVKIPYFAPQANSGNPIKVWHQLQERADAYLKKSLDDVIKADGEFDFLDDIEMMELLSDRESPVDDLQLFRLVLMWCKRFDGQQYLLDFTKHINFSKFQPDERTVADIDIMSDIGQYFHDLPKEYINGLMQQVHNALYQSELLQEEDIGIITGEKSHQWMLHYRMNIGETFPWNYLNQILGEDGSKLLILGVRVGSQEWILACNMTGIFRYEPVNIGSSHKVAVFVSRHTLHKGHELLNLPRGYLVELKELPKQRLDIYENTKKDTFISLIQDDEEEQTTILSIALNRFGQTFTQSRIRKQYVVACELFKLSSEPHVEHKPYHPVN